MVDLLIYEVYNDLQLRIIFIETNKSTKNSKEEDLKSFVIFFFLNYFIRKIKITIEIIIRYSVINLIYISFY